MTAAVAGHADEVIEHGAAIAPFHVEVARDILLFTQKRDTLGLPTAYPITAASVSRKV